VTRIFKLQLELVTSPQFKTEFDNKPIHMTKSWLYNYTEKVI
jgi:hypothetical protein